MLDASSEISRCQLIPQGEEYMYVNMYIYRYTHTHANLGICVKDLHGCLAKVRPNGVYPALGSTYEGI